MSKENITFKYCDEMVKKFEEVIEKPVINGSSVYYTGVDLGTACVVIAVLDENYKPVAGAYRYADVVRDGMVVDYIGAVRIVRELKEEIEEKLNTELIYAAAAIPPGTDELDSGAIKNVVQSAGFELTCILDEPTAANAVLKIKNGAVVDIGGGTTGISILKNGEVVYVVDEPTGGTHFSLVLSGAYKVPFKEADEFKRNNKNHKEILPILKPVVEKISSIINKYIKNYDVNELSLVGGTCCLTGIEDIIEKSTGVHTHKPKNPMFVTPLGIALSCTQDIIED
ncbi:ethanolamine utilization protein EutJ [Clostridium botulinum C]|uniref:Chaperone protein DnaK n=3 Tax=Clostridium botulinum TaxID=1491 RepID=A0A9Q4XW95_CLOBO|nr:MULTISPECIES: ethanolamine utilization protein EutJ [Clostridium]EGO86838.1 ethanolamine utilization protein EutJ [Clostridium botulinum C str. Stockholm]AYF54602.1 ethanolamine utilization protein EutJ [Clostridium novyi]KEI10188.1 ethanolamine utilization protein EutJ [Clostridium sp. K25]MCD3194557.1 ethanolamine utilization protein EutJ [Clostridium botulinum C]MCD3199711.1 ethanolamine utilization protein EutJ [Clostridium botulinum C]